MIVRLGRSFSQKTKVDMQLKDQRRNTSYYRSKDFSNYCERFFNETVKPNQSKVMIIRHAISEGNEKHLIYGWTDYDLTPAGIQQAEKLQPVLSQYRERFSSINSSALKRTFNTGGTALGIGLNPPDNMIRRDARFNEFDFGPLEGIYTGKMDFFEHEVFFQM